jgi:adenylate cyclase
MGDLSNQDPKVEKQWYEFLTNAETIENRMRRVYRFLPSNPRCKTCLLPFHGVGGTMMKAVFNRGRSSQNPLLCNSCEAYAARYPGGAEVEMTILFADIRGSSQLADKMSPKDFSQLVNRFFQCSFNVLAPHNALIDRLVGDGIIGYFVPGIAGQNHTHSAIQAARDLLKITGHADPGGPWVPVGCGLHRGVAFYGAVGMEGGIYNITALGDNVNTTAHLSAQAGAGEILISEEAYQAAKIEHENPAKCQVTLKGRSKPMDVRVLGV